MGKGWREYAVLYWGHRVSLLLKNGETVEGILGPGSGTYLVVDGRVLSFDRVADLRLIGRISKGIGPAEECKIYALDPRRGDYMYKLKVDEEGNYGLGGAKEQLRGGEFECEVDCHLVMDSDGSIQARDVRPRRLWHAIDRQTLEDKVFLYRLKAGGYFPAVLVEKNGTLVLEKLSGETFPLCPEEIADITRCPKAGDIRVSVLLLDGSEHRGTVTACLDEFFMLGLDPDGPRLHYNRIDRLRFFGYLTKTAQGDKVYNKKYYPCGRLPDPLPRAASYAIGVTADRLVARDPLEATAAGEDLPMRLGLVVCTKGMRGFIDDKYEERVRFGKNANFDLNVLLKADPKLDFGRNVYAVRYSTRLGGTVPGRAPEADRIELAADLEPYCWSKKNYSTVWIDDQGRVQAEEKYAKARYAPLYGLENLAGRWVRVTTDQGEVCVGYFLREEEDDLVLTAQKADTTATARIPKVSVAEVRGYGNVTAFKPDRGIGYIDSLYFHVNDMRDKDVQQGLLTSLGRKTIMVSFRLLWSEKGEHVAADDLVCVEQTQELRYAFVAEDGSRTVVKQKDFFHAGTEEETLARTAGPDPLDKEKPTVYKLQVGVIRALGAGPEEKPLVQWIEAVKAWEKPRCLSLDELERTATAKVPGVEYAYGVLFHFEDSDFYLLRQTFVNNRWDPALQKMETTWDRTALCDAEQLKGVGENGKLAKNRLYLLRYVRGDKVENPTGRGRMPIHTVDANYPVEVLWEEPSVCAFAGFRDGRWIYSTRKTVKEDPGRREEEARSPWTRRMDTLFNQGDGCMKSGDFSAAKQYFEKWMEAYQKLCTIAPEKEKDLKPWLIGIQKRLKAAEVLAALPVRTRLDGARIEDIGAEAAANFKDCLDDEPARLADARNILKAVENGASAGKRSSAFCWGMVKCYEALWEKAKDAKDLIGETPQLALAAALLAEARNSYVKESDKPEAGAYLCRLALTLRPEWDEALALYLAPCLLSAEELRNDIYAGGANTTGVGPLLSAATRPRLPELAWSTLSLFCVLPETKKTAADGFGMAEGKRVEQYQALLAKYLGESAPSELEDRIDRATEKFRAWRDGLLGGEQGKSARMWVQGVRDGLVQMPLRSERFPRDESEKGIDELLRKLSVFDENMDASARIAGLEELIKRRRTLEEELSERSYCLDHDLLLPVLKKLQARLETLYSKACRAAKSDLTIRQTGFHVGSREKSLRVCVQGEMTRGGSQGLEAPTLTVKASEAFTLEGINEDGTIPGIVSGSIVSFEFWLMPKDKDLERLFLDVQARYTYKTGRLEGEMATAVYPAEGEYQGVEVAIEKDGRQEISGDRLETLGLNGVPLDEDDPELAADIRKILQNRDKDLNEIVAKLGKIGEDGKVELFDSRWIILQGQWRVGKTTLLQLVADRMDSAVTCVVSCSPAEDVEGENYEATFVKELLAELNGQLKELAEQAETAGAETLWSEGKRLLEKELLEKELESGKQISSLRGLASLLNEWMRELRKKDSRARLLLLMDEFTHIYAQLKAGRADGSFLTAWASFATSVKAATITAGGEFTWEMMKSFGSNGYQKAYVKQLEYLDWEATKAFLRFAIPDASYFHDQLVGPVVDWLYQLTQGNSFLLNKLCEWLIDYINSNLNEGSVSRYLTVGTVQAALDALRCSDDYRVGGKNQWFSFLYDPYNEGTGNNGAQTQPLLSDKGSRRVNEAVLDAIVKNADPVTHACLRSHVENALGELEKEKLDAGIASLVRRGVVLQTGDSKSLRLRIRVDLFYELERRAGPPEGLRRDWI